MAGVAGPLAHPWLSLRPSRQSVNIQWSMANVRPPTSADVRQSCARPPLGGAQWNEGFSWVRTFQFHPMHMPRLFETTTAKPSVPTWICVTRIFELLHSHLKEPEVWRRGHVRGAFHSHTTLAGAGG